MIDNELQKAIQAIERLNIAWKPAQARHGEKIDTISFSKETEGGTIHGILKLWKENSGHNSYFTLDVKQNAVSLFYGVYKYDLRFERKGFFRDKVPVYEQSEEYKYLLDLFNKSRNPIMEKEQAEARTAELKRMQKEKELKDKFFGK